MEIEEIEASKKKFLGIVHRTTNCVECHTQLPSSKSQPKLAEFKYFGLCGDCGPKAAKTECECCEEHTLKSPLNKWATNKFGFKGCLKCIEKYLRYGNPKDCSMCRVNRLFGEHQFCSTCRRLMEHTAPMACAICGLPGAFKDSKSTPGSRCCHKCYRQEKHDLELRRNPKLQPKMSQEETDQFKKEESELLQQIGVEESLIRETRISILNIKGASGEEIKTSQLEAQEAKNELANLKKKCAEVVKSARLIEAQLSVQRNLMARAKSAARVRTESVRKDLVDRVGIANNRIEKVQRSMDTVSGRLATVKRTMEEEKILLQKSKVEIEKLKQLLIGLEEEARQVLEEREESGGYKRHLKSSPDHYGREDNNEGDEEFLISSKNEMELKDENGKVKSEEQGPPRKKKKLHLQSAENEEDGSHEMDVEEEKEREEDNNNAHSSHEDDFLTNVASQEVSNINQVEEEIIAKDAAEILEDGLQMDGIEENKGDFETSKPDTFSSLNGLEDTATNAVISVSEEFEKDPNVETTTLPDADSNVDGKISESQEISALKVNSNEIALEMKVDADAAESQDKMEINEPSNISVDEVDIAQKEIA